STGELGPVYSGRQFARRTPTWQRLRSAGGTIMRNIFSHHRPRVDWLHLSQRPLFRPILVGAVTLCVVASTILGMIGALSHTASAATQTATFTLDNVTVTVATPFLPAQRFATARPGLPSQIASAVAWSPFREFSVTAIPFGKRSATELGIIAGPGSAAYFRTSLHTFRQRQHAQQQAGPVATLFGMPVTSNVS